MWYLIKHKKSITLWRICFLSACLLILQGNISITTDPLLEAEELMNRGAWDEAIEILERAYSDSTEQIENHGFSNVISNIGYAYWQKGDLEKSLHYFVEAVNFKHQNNLTNDPSYIQTLQNLSQVLKLSGRYEEAKALFIRIIDLVREEYGTTNYQYAKALSNFADFYYEIGYYNKSYELYGKAYKTVSILFSGDSPEFGKASTSMGRILTKIGVFDEAEKHLEHGISIFKNSQPENSIQYVQSLEYLGVLYEIQGKYGEAEKILLNVLEFKRSRPNPDQESLIETYNELGILYQNLGNLDRAANYFTMVREKCEKQLGKNHSYYAIAINNLATIAKYNQNYTLAKSLFKESLEIYDLLYGRHHPLYADGLNNLAAVESKLSQFDLAEQHYQKVLMLDSMIYGKDHPYYATTLNNLGILLFRKGEVRQAEKMYLQSLQIRKNALGINHPTYARSLENLGLYHFSQGNLIEAEKFFREAIAIQKNQIRTIFPVLTESERKMFYEMISQDIERYNYIALSLADSNPEMIEHIINNQIQTKAILLSATEKVRQSILKSNDKLLIEDYKSWMDLKTRLVGYYHVGKARLGENGIDLAGLESRIEEIEKRIIHRRGSFEILQDVRITWQDIQQQLDNDEVTIEIVRIREFDLDKTGQELVFGFNQKSKYLAIIVFPASTPEFVVISNGNDLEKEIYSCYRNSLQFKIKDLVSYAGFWERIDEKIGSQINRVFVSPDGVYHKVNPNTFLIREGEYVIDRYFVNYLTNCSDILPKRSPVSKLKRATLIGDPEFHLGGESRLLSQLPGTGDEIDQIQSILKNEMGWSTMTYKQERATEYHLKESYQPSLLHIATHGFFTHQDKLAMTLVPEEIHNMFKSGVYLAGVENTYQSRQSGIEYDSFNDGVLTAYEAMNLSLEGTEIVILSACNTGIGDVVNGEGVYGLQRAFIVAGAANLVISLTEIDDRATEKLMTHFYKNFSDNQSIDIALRNAQLKLRSEYPHPHYWGSFIMVGRGSKI